LGGGIDSSGIDSENNGESRTHSNRQERMKALRVALLLSVAAVVFGRVVSHPLLWAQEPPPKTDGAAVPAGTADMDAKMEAATNQMHAMQEGLKAYRAENFGTAAASFETAAAARASGTPTAHAYAWLTRSYLHLHRVPEAEAAAKKATEVDKDLGNAQTAMAEVYFREGKLTDAANLLVSLTKSQNVMSRTYLGLANIQRSMGNYKSARALIELAHKGDPKDPDIEKSWRTSMTLQERLEEWKRRLAEGKFEDGEERQNLTGDIALMEDLEKNANRSCRQVNKVSTTTAKLVPHYMDPQRMSGYKLGVKVNGVNASLQLDTGASGILVSSRIAEKASLAKVGDYAIQGIGDQGASRGYAAFANKLEIGQLEFENCYIRVVDDKRNGALLDGLIGTDVFDDYLIELNFPDSLLRLSQLPPYPDQAAEQPSLQSERTASAHLHDRWIPPEYKNFEVVFRFGHMLLLPVRLNKAPYRLFLLDTGAWDDTVTPAAAREATKVYADPNMKVKGLSGEVNKVYTTGDILLTFGRFQQRRNDMVAFDLTRTSNSIGTEISGTLGFDMLNLLDIKLDYRDNLVDFQYNPNRIH
jgi:tetratricopeptide (TPR) repeat protein